MDDDETVVEVIGFSDFNSIDEHFSVGRRGGGGRDGEAAIGGDGLNLSAEG